MKYFIAAIALIYSSASYSQVYKYKAFNTYFKYFDETGKAIRTSDSISVDFLVVFNFPKNRINTYGKQEGNMDLISTLEDTTDQDGNVERIYTGIDQFGEKCEVHMKFYKAGYESDCILYYYYATPGVSMVYKLKKDL